MHVLFTAFESVQHCFCKTYSNSLYNYNYAGAAPFESMNVADIGDVPINPFSVAKSLEIITEYYDRVLEAGCVPLTMGGEHTITYPILRSVAEKHGPVGVVMVSTHLHVHYKVLKMLFDRISRLVYMHRLIILSQVYECMCVYVCV